MWKWLKSLFSDTGTERSPVHIHDWSTWSVIGEYEIERFEATIGFLTLQRRKCGTCGKVELSKDRVDIRH